MCHFQEKKEKRIKKRKLRKQKRPHQRTVPCSKFLFRESHRNHYLLKLNRLSWRAAPPDAHPRRPCPSALPTATASLFPDPCLATFQFAGAFVREPAGGTAESSRFGFTDFNYLIALTIRLSYLKSGRERPHQKPHADVTGTPRNYQSSGLCF
ncbi:hypothetical protein GWI33_017175 [Rhynchophorus ferrugineus]|uniref:Uncharacterized protein n=1 Tax=Rhynchophorus ferrugineus TaxID=354439 RepID=A0A834M9E6_RHYFE|nr:hypothetical protein GWI33_017175 [Rhynchophorus ferrugineus]